MIRTGILLGNDNDDKNKQTFQFINKQICINYSGSNEMQDYVSFECLILWMDISPII